MSLLHYSPGSQGRILSGKSLLKVLLHLTTMLFNLAGSSSSEGAFVVGAKPCENQAEGV